MSLPQLRAVVGSVTSITPQPFQPLLADALILIPGRAPPSPQRGLGVSLPKEENQKIWVDPALSDTLQTESKTLLVSKMKIYSQK